MTATQLATMSDAQLNARLCSRKVTDALLDRLATIPLSDALEQLTADAAEAERIERAGEELGEHDSNGRA